MSDEDLVTKPFKFVTAGKRSVLNHWTPDSPPAAAMDGPFCLSRPMEEGVATRNDGEGSFCCCCGGADDDDDCEDGMTKGTDARFPNVNQTKHCWQNYVDYHKCINAKGEDFAPCRQFWYAYRSLCPSGWYTRWDDQRESGNFPCKLE